MLSLLYVFYIELELSLSGGFRSITIVKDSSIFYNKLALPYSLRLFTNPGADINGIWDGLIISILSFKRNLVYFQYICVIHIVKVS